MTQPADGAPGELAALASQIAADVQHGGDDDVSRARAAATVAQLEAALGRLAPAGVPGIDLARVGGALQLLGDWLRTPSPDTQARADAALTDLQFAMGIPLGEPETDAARRAQYRREARAALDQIFPKKP